MTIRTVIDNWVKQTGGQYKKQAASAFITTEFASRMKPALQIPDAIIDIYANQKPYECMKLWMKVKLHTSHPLYILIPTESTSSPYVPTKALNKTVAVPIMTFAPRTREKPKCYTQWTVYDLPVPHNPEQLDFDDVPYHIDITEIGPLIHGAPLDPSEDRDIADYAKTIIDFLEKDALEQMRQIEIIDKLLHEYPMATVQGIAQLIPQLIKHDQERHSIIQRYYMYKSMH